MVTKAVCRNMSQNGTICKLLWCEIKRLKFKSTIIEVCQNVICRMSLAIMREIWNLT